MTDSKIVGQRMKNLRDGIRLSQAKLAAHIKGLDQSGVYRYESGYSFPPYAILVQYADFFDVSLDYLFGRTDNPQGKLYEFVPKSFQNDENMQGFIEMCFDPKSPANAKLKEAVLKLMEEKSK